MNEGGVKDRHRRELKELQAKIQAVKKSVPKGDKKAKKKSVEEIALLQKELSDRHERELKEFESLSNDVEHINLEEGHEAGIAGEQQDESVKKMSKSEKRREAKAAATQKKLEQISELSSEVTKRSTEHFKITEHLKSFDLSVYEIAADGNCMFYALQHQLQDRGLPQSVNDLRETAANYMTQHQDDFLPYLVHPKTGDMLSLEEFATYCREIKTDGVWGGMHEAHAISSSLKVPIKILQADVPPIVFGEGYVQEPVILLYYKHKYGLGEHYDSITPCR